MVDVSHSALPGQVSAVRLPSRVFLCESGRGFAVFCDEACLERAREHVLPKGVVVLNVCEPCRHKLLESTGQQVDGWTQLPALCPECNAKVAQCARILVGVKGAGIVTGNGSEVCDEAPKPIPMILTCPACGARHIDSGAFATKVHHTHSCQSCGLTWRPAVVPTVGVQFLPGFKDAPTPHDALAPIRELAVGWRSIAETSGPGQAPVLRGCASDLERALAKVAG